MKQNNTLEIEQHHLYTHTELKCMNVQDAQKHSFWAELLLVIGTKMVNNPLVLIFDSDFIYVWIVRIHVVVCNEINIGQWLSTFFSFSRLYAREPVLRSVIKHTYG